MAETARSQREELDTAREKIKLLRKPWLGLTKDDHRSLIKQADKLRKQRDAERLAREERVREERAAAERRAVEERQRRFEEHSARRQGPKKRQKAPERPQEREQEHTPTRPTSRSTSRHRGPGRGGMSR